MATGLSLQLTRQIGEHLIAAKLGRMGYVAALFAGNVIQTHEHKGDFKEW